MTMHRSLLIASDGGIERVDETLYELNLGSTAPEVMVAELELLVSGLAPSITLRHRSNKLQINVSCGDVAGRATAETTTEKLALTLSKTEIGYWLAYFARYYRDGVAEVDHIDVEAVSTKGVGVDVRLRVARSAPAVSPEEARRRLGG